MGGAISRAIRFVFLGDMASLERAARKSKDALSGIGKAHSQASGAVQDFSATLASRLPVGSGTAEKALNKLGTSALASGGLLRLGVVGGAAAAGAALVKMAADGVSSFVNLASEVRSFQRVSGTSAETASKFVAVFRALGVDSDAAGAGIAKLSRTIETNAKALNEQGVAIARNQDGSANVIETFLNISDAIANSTDAAYRNNLAFAAFGRQGLNLLPILARGRQGFEKLARSAELRGEILSQEQVDQGREFQVAMREASRAVDSVSRELGVAVLPLLTEVVQLAEKFVTALNNAKAPKWADDLGLPTLEGTFGRLLPKIEAGQGVVGKLGERFGWLEKETKKSGEAAEEHTRQLTQEIEEAGETARQADELAGAMRSLDSAKRGARNASEGLADAQGRVGDAQADLNKLLKQGATDAKEVEAAEREVEMASRRVEDAQRDLERSSEAVVDAQLSLRSANEEVADAQQRVIDAQRELNELFEVASPDEQADAALSVRGAELALARARQRVVQAQKDQIEAQQERDPEAEYDALLSLQEAELGVEQATRNLTRAQEEQNEVNEQGKPTADQLREAEENLTDAQWSLEQSTRNQTSAQRGLNEATRGVTDAQRALGDATRGVTDAQRALTEAVAGDVNFSEKVRAAQDAVRDARRGVRDATESQRDALLRLAEAQEAENALLADGGTAAFHLRKQFEALAQKYPEVAPALDGLLSRLRAFDAPLPATQAQQSFRAGERAFANRRMASGGIVRATPGGVPAILGEGGKDEAVIPLQNGAVPIEGGSSGSTTVLFQPRVTITAATNASARDIAEEVKRVLRDESDHIVAGLQRYVGRNGPLPSRITGR